MKKIRILGTRGIPAQHGGFETFAEHLALHLTKQDWEVVVYCQEEGQGKTYETTWKGIKLIHIPVKQKRALGTIIFDWKATLHSCKDKNLALVLGYNTAIFSILYRLLGIKSIMNMDGIEWKRHKWSKLEKIWLHFNERCGRWFSNHLIADHPEIKNYLKKETNENKITMIPYGADEIHNADESILTQYGLKKREYAIVIARPEPENSIYEIVHAFSQRKRNIKLVVLGNYDKAENLYKEKVFSAASGEVIFPGAIYDKEQVSALRYHALFYAHGHQVGGTNPSLVEALGAGSPVLAHNNKYNKWVVKESSQFFSSKDECAEKITHLLENKADLEQMRIKSKENFRENFTWLKILSAYEELLSDWAGTEVEVEIKKHTTTNAPYDPKN